MATFTCPEATVIEILMMERYGTYLLPRWVGENDL
jgi:hypothetical protein